MLVRSPLLTSHKWRELVSSGRFVCRCHGVFFWWCYVCFVLLRFRLYAFVEAASLCSIVLRYAGVPIVARVSFFFFFPHSSFGDVAFSDILRIYIFLVPFSLSPCMESTSYVLPSGWCFFYLVTTGWIFDISYVRNQSIIQSINHRTVGLPRIKNTNSRGEWYLQTVDTGNRTSLVQAATSDTQHALSYRSIAPKITSRSIVVAVVVFFTLTDRASTIPSYIRGCQSGTWSQRGTKVNGSHCRARIGEEVIILT